MAVTLYQQILSKRERIEKELIRIHEKLQELPEGKLVCSRNSGRFKWYLSDGHNLTYLPKKQRKLAKQLAYKKYLSALAEDLQRERIALDFYLRHHDEDSKCVKELFSETSGYTELLASSFTPLSQELLDWTISPYESNEKYPEQRIHKTSTGIYVRSKSEAIITMMLHTRKIPFRYECALQLGNHKIFPDFTIRHPETGEYFYWEHFGLMDDPEYCHNAFSKMQLYAANQIYPSIQLITTFETKDHPLSTDLVEKVIQQYFGSE